MFATIIMMDIQKFLKKFNDTIRYSEFGNGYEIAFPFAFPNDDHISSVFISEDETGDRLRLPTTAIPSFIWKITELTSKSMQAE